MSTTSSKLSRRPRVCLVGEHQHSDFSDVIAALGVGTELSFDTVASAGPELIIVARSRPAAMDGEYIGKLRRTAPLAGIVALMGSWCEGQARASRQKHNALQLYWYQFVPWWRRQLALLARGRCPDWARPDGVGSPSPSLVTSHSSFPALIALSTPRWESAEALADLLQRSGYSTIWQPPGRPIPVVRNVAAGIWDGGQLDENEVDGLADFCRRLAGDRAPVVALLDFPRRDRCELARQIGAACVLGKPWLNSDLLETLTVAAATQHETAA